MVDRLADLFPGFASHWVDILAGRIFARSAGAGRALVLLHGFSQTHACWHRIAPHLAQTFTVVAMDLRGYGRSSAPSGDNGTHVYTKRAMGRDGVTVMQALGHSNFALIGHDRGARVGYRLALDESRRLTQLVLLDIGPTFRVWDEIRASPSIFPHWRFLAGSQGKPEAEIERDPDGYFEGLLAKWSKSGDLSGFDPQALAHYRASWGEQARIHAFCEDYRAGATTDVTRDQSDMEARQRIRCPVLLVCGKHYLTGALERSLKVWRDTFAPTVLGAEVDAAHFVAEEAPEETLEAIVRFLQARHD